MTTSEPLVDTETGLLKLTSLTVVIGVLSVIQAYLISSIFLGVIAGVLIGCAIGAQFMLYMEIRYGSRDSSHTTDAEQTNTQP